MTDQNTTPKVEPAYILTGFCSFLFPGLGQLLLDKKTKALCFFIWFLTSWLITFKVIFSNDFGLSVIMIILSIMPHIFSAYFAANGHKITSPKSRKGTWLEGSIFDN